MKTKYLDFIKLNENKHNIISISEIEKVFKEVFDDTKVSSVKTLYDYDEDRKETKLIISINNLFYNETNIIFTKFVFVVDDKKEKLRKNQFSYLYDINCDFRTVSFDDTDEMIIKMNEILEGEKFGQNLKDLSDISVTMTSNTNEWLSDNGVDNISIYSIKYQPLVDNISCDSLFFRFEINIDDSEFIELNIRKNEDNEFKLSFNKGDWFHHVTIPDIKGTIQTIGDTIKNYIK